MTEPLSDKARRVLLAAFRMPLVQTMVQRKSSITNAFVNSIIPVIAPSAEEIGEVLALLVMVPEDVRCAYCGDTFTEWDHLRPLVLNRRPTGYVSEIANLVPSCGKCNQSKGNQPWRRWMQSESAGRSPTARRIEGTHERIARLERFEQWREPTCVDFESLLGKEVFEAYWQLCDAVNAQLRDAQAVADAIRATILSKRGS